MSDLEWANEWLARLALSEQRALVRLAAEVGHELAHTISFIQCVVEDGVSASELGARGGEELERLRCLIRGLRHLAAACSDQTAER